MQSTLAVPRRPGKLAFGVEPSHRCYRLRFARYAGLAEIVAEQAASAPGKTLHVLDAGCGRGRLPRYYRTLQGERAPAVDFAGIDVSVPRLAGARGAGYRLLARAAVERLPFRDGSFDGVVCEQVIEHFKADEMAGVLAELRRVMRPSAFLVVGVPLFTRMALAFKPLWRNPTSRIGQRLVRRFANATPAHEQHFSLPAMSRLLEEHGFGVERVQGYRLFSLPNAWLEDSERYYRAHRWAGRVTPGLCSEADFVCVRRSGIDRS